MSEKNNFSKNSEFLLISNLNSEFQKIIVWFTDQNSQSLETEDKINLTLMIK